MPFYHLSYIQKYLAAPANEAAAKYGVRIIPAITTPGLVYYRCIGVHHLSGEENHEQHNVFVDVLDEQGKRIGPPWALIGWAWEGQRPDELASPVILDKPLNEPGGNIALHAGQIVTLWVLGRAASDKVEKLQTGFDDEEPGNNRFHHSFYVVFQRVIAGGTLPTEIDPVPEPIPVPVPTPIPAPVYTVRGPFAPYYRIITPSGEIIAGQVSSQAWAKRIVTALTLLDAHENDHSIQAYIQALKEQL